MTSSITDHHSVARYRKGERVDGQADLVARWPRRSIIPIRRRLLFVLATMSVFLRRSRVGTPLALDDAGRGSSGAAETINAALLFTGESGLLEKEQSKIKTDENTEIG